jgi:hypothetical protein
MVIEIGNQLLDHDTEPSQLVLAKPLGFAELARCFGCLGDRPLAAEAAGQLIRI